MPPVLLVVKLIGSIKVPVHTGSITGMFTWGTGFTVIVITMGGALSHSLAVAVIEYETVPGEVPVAVSSSSIVLPGLPVPDSPPVALFREITVQLNVISSTSLSRLISVSSPEQMNSETGIAVN